MNETQAYQQNQNVFSHSVQDVRVLGREISLAKARF